MRAQQRQLAAGQAVVTCGVLKELVGVTVA